MFQVAVVLFERKVSESVIGSRRILKENIGPAVVLVVRTVSDHANACLDPACQFCEFRFDLVRLKLVREQLFIGGGKFRGIIVCHGFIREFIELYFKVLGLQKRLNSRNAE